MYELCLDDGGVWREDKKLLSLMPHDSVICIYIYISNHSIYTYIILLYIHSCLSCGAAF